MLIMYENLDDTITEWSNQLYAKYKTPFPIQSDKNSTLLDWKDRLTRVMGKPFFLKDDVYATLLEWSRLL